MTNTAPSPATNRHPGGDPGCQYCCESFDGCCTEHEREHAAVPSPANVQSPLAQSGGIFIKSLFGGWRPAGREKSLEYARWKFRAIYKGKGGENELLSAINGRIQRVQFTLDDLR